MPGSFSCCDTLNALAAEPRVAGHHALCPRCGLGAIEARRASAVEVAPVPWTGPDEDDPRPGFVWDAAGGGVVRLADPRVRPFLQGAPEDVAVLLTALREERAEAAGIAQALSAEMELQTRLAAEERADADELRGMNRNQAAELKILRAKLDALEPGWQGALGPAAAGEK